MLEMKQDVNGTNGVETLERESKVQRCAASRVDKKNFTTYLSAALKTLMNGFLRCSFSKAKCML